MRFIDNMPPIFRYLGLICLGLACIPNDATNLDNATVKVSNVELALPAAKATLGIQDFLTQLDTSKIKFGAQTAFGRPIISSYTDTIVSRGITTATEVSDKVINKTVAIPPIALPNLNTATTLTVGNILAGNPPDGSILIPFALPDVTNDLPLSSASQFEWIEFEKGTIELSVTNNTEAILSFTYEIRNKSDNSLVGSATFTNIPAKGSQVRTIDLKNKILRNAAQFVLKTLSNSRSGGTLRYVDNIIFNLAFKDPTYKRVALRFNKSITFSKLDTINLDQKDVETWRLLLKTGNLTYQLNSDLPRGLAGTIKLTLPDFKLNSSTIEENINFRSGSPASGSLVLDGSEVDLTNYTPPHSHFGLRVDVDVRASDPTQVLEFSNTNSIGIGFGIKNFKYNFFEGVIKKQRVPLQKAELNFTLIDSTLSNTNTKLNQVVMNIQVSNGYGVDSQLEVERLRFENKKNDSLNMVVSPNPSIIAAGNPSITQTNPKITQLNVDNAPDIANLAPYKLDYNLDLTVNPNNNAFKIAFNDKSTVDVLLEVGIVLAGSIEGLVKTLDFKSDFGNLKKELDNITSSSLRVFSDNTLPIDLSLQILLLDEADQITDSLFSKGNERIIRAGATNSSGAVTASTITTLDIPIDLDKFINSKKIRLRISANTENNGTKSVIFYDRNQVIIELGFKIKGSVSQKL